MKIVLGIFRDTSSGHEYEDENEDESGVERFDDDYDNDDSKEWVSESDEEEPEFGRRVSPSRKATVVP